ncbi:MAG: DUF4956 domain-containing protein [Promethearchaeota archaeon]|nr:MAG: DUF4956 domain-containing protein [Candidatus Lokiarchaeota archaeon]
MEKSFRNLGTEVDLMDAILVMFWSLVLSIIIAITYRGTHRGVSYSQTFTQNLVLIGVIVGVVMLIIGTNIARAFTLLGALSIVRFRNAVKDSRDVGFIFFVMAIGMACGTQFFPIAMIATFVGCGLMYFMTYTQFGQKGLAQDILEMYFPVDKDYAKVLTPIFITYLKYYSLLGVDSIDENTNRLSFIVTFKKKSPLLSLSSFKKSRDTFEDKLTPKAKLLAEIQKIPYIKNVKVIEGSSSIEI